MKKLLLFGLFLTFLFHVSSCEKKQTPSAVQKENNQKILNFGIGGEPGTLDPQKAVGTWANSITGNIFLGLMTEDAAGNTVLGSAKQYKVSDDGLEYTFSLRQNKWSDGVPVTAHDFEFSFKRILSPNFHSKNASLLYPIKNAQKIKKGDMSVDTLEISALDDHTLKIRLEYPAPYFLSMLMHQAAYPVPKHAVEKLGMNWAKTKNLIGNGAYALKEWIPSTHVKIEKNPHFYDAENVKIDTVYFYPTEESGAALQKFRAGELHFNSGVPEDRVDWLRVNLKDEFVSGAFTGVFYLVINLNRPKLQNKNIRRALALSIDKTIIVEKILNTGEYVANAIVPPIGGFETLSKSIVRKPYAELLAEAKIIMEDAGYNSSNLLDIELRYNISEKHKKVMIGIASMWKKIHVRATLVNSDVGVHYDELLSQNFDIARFSWSADYKDPQNFLFLFESGANYNVGEFNNPKFDALMQQSSLKVGKKRNDILLAAEQIIIDEYPAIPIYFFNFNNLVSKKLTGYKSNSVNIHRIRYMDLR